MWPLDAFVVQEVIRVGPLAIELWKGSTAGMGLVDRVPLAQRGSMYDVQQVVEPLRSLYDQLTRPRVSLVMESAYAPTLLADTGGSLWNAKQVETLLRHRFGLTYGSPDINVATWKIRTVHRYGERYALGFAMAPAVEDALRESATLAKIEFADWSPALAWALDRFSPLRKWPRRTGWWVWAEQDRCLVINISRGRFESLNAAVALPKSNEVLEQMIGAEEGRQGIGSAQSPIGYAHWSSEDRLAGTSERARDLSVETIDARTNAPTITRPNLNAAS